ncbi:N-acetylneuraminate synthase family protein [Leptospira sp. FAT2]|uniref:N-acetylneuraminate synthase family protein n=1 Tax=Leptospira sanjuanensis TaxID=2879643 RepID=UPI001EE89434|nr:N-acetylneuraminate synthase family protein [Leptospira sanjuanensis]MCG6167589.1 N-acetylneuraminate synthase family protein [Leptospira sanjuanensis]MCG6193008.1 N-acetylneuraminate synthase family protein [Leptospira sanjuanensis]
MSKNMFNLFNHSPVIIAEIGGNFKNFEEAKLLIDSAMNAGADCVKLQHFRAETLATKKAMFDMENTGKISQFDYFKEHELSEELTTRIFQYCKEKNILIFSTPSHPTDVDFLEKYDVLVHKIGSDDATNIPLLKHVARTQKIVLLSTGMCTMTEVQRSVDSILEEGNDKIVLFHCTTNYPTHPESVNLNAMISMQKQFGNIPVGYSDHTLGIDTCYVATILGAKVLEFHFTYDKNAEGPDHMLSKEPNEVFELVRKIRQLPILLGDGIKRPAKSEMNTRRNNRKSLVLTSDIKKGEKISPLNMDIKRPGYGISCEYYFDVIGKTASKDLEADNVLIWEDIY